MATLRALRAGILGEHRLEALGEFDWGGLHGGEVPPGPLQEWLSVWAQHLRLKFFAEDHLKRYEKRATYFPLSSENRSFVAWVSIHRWTDPDFRVDEVGSDGYRAELERSHPETVRELREAEARRRERKQGGAAEVEDQGLLDLEDEED